MIKTTNKKPYQVLNTVFELIEQLVQFEHQLFFFYLYRKFKFRL